MPYSRGNGRKVYNTSGLKSAIKLHRGLRGDRKAKLIHFYLTENSKLKWSEKPKQNSL